MGRPRSKHHHLLPGVRIIGERYYFFATRPDAAGKRPSAFLAKVGDEDGMRRAWAQHNLAIPNVHRPAHLTLPVDFDSPMVYFIRANRGAVKIGFTASRAGLKKRLDDVQTGSAVRLRIIGAVPGSMKDERRAHRALHAHRSSGEWFGPSTEVTAYIARAISDGAIPS